MTAHSAVPDRQPISADEFMQLEDENGVYLELVEGRILRTPARTVPHALAMGDLMYSLGQYIATTKLGELLGPCSFKIESKPDTVLIPDVSFISRDRIPVPLPDTYMDGPPDLAVEVLSDHDPLPPLEDKVRRYLKAGVRLVWIVDPGDESVTVFEPGGGPVTLRHGQLLDGDPVVPGFDIPVEQIFRRLRDHIPPRHV